MTPEEREIKQREKSQIKEMLKAYSAIIELLDPLPHESREKVIRATAIILGL